MGEHYTGDQSQGKHLQQDVTGTKEGHGNGINKVLGINDHAAPEWVMTLTNTEQHFKKYLKEFIQQSIISCNDEYLKNRQIYDNKIPSIDFSNQTPSITYNDTIDHKKLIFSLKTTIKKYPRINSLVKIIKNILKTEVDSIESKKTRKLDIDDRELESQLFYCVFYYLENYGFEFKKSNFNKTFSTFNIYLHQHFYNYCYLTPLYNFDGDFECCQISPTLWIQKIPCKLYNEIINLNLDIKDVPSYQRQLRYALFCNVMLKNTHNPQFIALENFENSINALKLFECGEPRFGDMFGVDSEDWPGYGLKIIERGHERPPSSSGKYYLNSKKARNFTRFYEKLDYTISNLAKKSDFLESSIRRYGMASHHRKPVDKIVDYVICLESLLVPNIGDATLKLAHRMSALLGDDDVERIRIWKFAKVAYKFRSGYLHKSTERPFKIDSEHLELDKASDELECFSRVSIMRIIQLLDKYDSQEKIVDELDQSIYDRSKLRNLQKIWKIKF